MIVLAGVPLPCPNREILTDIERDISIEKMLLLFSRSWPGPANVFLAMPTHYRCWPPWSKPGNIINRFYWPTGASRWGCGCFLATKDQCNAIHDACFGADGRSSNFVNLTLSTATPSGVIIESVSIDYMRVFPPIPLYRILNPDFSSDHGLYLILVVDDRFYWWNIPCPDFGITETSGTTWADVLNAIAYDLDEDIAFSDIPDAYLAPHRALNLTNEPLPLVFDAVAYNIGARVVVDYNGDIFVQRFPEALIEFQNNINLFPNRKYLGGDSRFVSLF